MKGTALLLTHAFAVTEHFIAKIDPNASSTKTYLKKRKNVKDFTFLRQHNQHPGEEEMEKY